MKHSATPGTTPRTREPTREPAFGRQHIVDEILSLPQFASWPELVSLVYFPDQQSGQEAELTACWQYPRVACEAVGGKAAQALPGMAATVCMLLSIHLVDDMLDNEPGALHERLGPGRTANLALALQAAAGQILERAHLSHERLAAAHGCVARAAFATAWGQELDASPPETFSEQAYWNAIDTKTPPLFGAALELGAILGGANLETARALARLGQPIGRIIQVSDDLKDALATPAGPDWTSRWNNLAILFAYLMDHPDKARFHELVTRVQEPSAFVEAKDILIRSGALSYCCFQMGESYGAAMSMVADMGADMAADMALGTREPLVALLRALTYSVRGLFASHGLAVPEVFASET